MLKWLTISILDDGKSIYVPIFSTFALNPITIIHLNKFSNLTRYIAMYVKSSRLHAAMPCVVSISAVCRCIGMGQRIFEEEQQGKERADYGAYLLQNLAKTLGT